MSEPPDVEEAVRRVQAGEVEAFETVLRAHEWSIRSFVISRCPPGGDADDVAQTTFLEAFRRIADYRPGTDFRAWLFTIARYQLLAESTRLRRRADYHSRYIPHALQQALERRAREGETEVDQRLESLRTCLTRLAQRDREVLEMRYDEAVSLAVIASRTGRSVGAIKKHLYQLRQKLHECIERKLAPELPE